jgi:tRNA G10  N-methylase Trm11
LKRIDDEHRAQAIPVLINMILDRHSKKMKAKYFYRLLEHRSLVNICETFKRDMEANQDEFVYVTVQDR